MNEAFTPVLECPHGCVDCQTCKNSRAAKNTYGLWLRGEDLRNKYTELLQEPASPAALRRVTEMLEEVLLGGMVPSHLAKRARQVVADARTIIDDPPPRPELAAIWDQAITWSDADRPLPEDAEIDAAHPLETGRHDLYAEAARLVHARRSKGGLVELVSWLLLRAVRAEDRTSHEVGAENGGTP